MVDNAGTRKYEKAMRTGIIQSWRAVSLALALALLTAAGAGAVQVANDGRGGETLDLQKLREKGKTTVIEFYSPFCPPCLRLAPLLEELSRKRPDLAIKKVNINRPEVKGIDWKSPLAQQHRIRSVPYFVIFSPRGKATEGRAASGQVQKWLEEAGVLK
jgi:thiol-disulfide isomerase/thioredoxin